MLDKTITITLIEIPLSQKNRQHVLIDTTHEEKDNVGFIPREKCLIHVGEALNSETILWDTLCVDLTPKGGE